MGERLLVQLDFNDFHLNNPRLLAIDLPINPLPIRSFIKKQSQNNNNKENKNNNNNKKQPKAMRSLSLKENKYSTDNALNNMADDMLSKLDAVLKPNDVKSANKF